MLEAIKKAIKTYMHVRSWPPREITNIHIYVSIWGFIAFYSIVIYSKCVLWYVCPTSILWSWNVRLNILYVVSFKRYLPLKGKYILYTVVVAEICHCGVNILEMLLVICNQHLPCWVKNIRDSNLYPIKVSGRKMWDTKIPDDSLGVPCRKLQISSPKLINFSCFYRGYFWVHIMLSSLDLSGQALPTKSTTHQLSRSFLKLPKQLDPWV